MENLIERPNVKKVNSFIEKYKSSLSVITLKETAKTAKDAAKSLNCEVGAIVKSLVIKLDNTFLLCLVAGDKKCCFKLIKLISNKEKISMANPEEVKIQTGFSIGGVSPVAHKNKLPIFIDKSLNRFKFLYAAAGHPNCIFKVNYSDLLNMTQAIEHNISE